MKIKLLFNSSEDVEIARRILTPRYATTYGSSMCELLISPTDRREICELLNQNNITFTMS